MSALFLAVLTLLCSCCGIRKAATSESVSVERLSSREDNITHVIDTLEVRKYHFVTIAGDTVNIHDSVVERSNIIIRDTVRECDTVYQSVAESKSEVVVRRNSDGIFGISVILLAASLWVYVARKNK